MSEAKDPPGSDFGLPERVKSITLPPLRKAPSKRRATVCVISFHPLLLAEFLRLLGEEVRLIDRRVESNKAPAATLAVPKASVYVVEAHGERHATEGFVGAILAHYPKARIVVMAESFMESNSFPLLRLGAKGLLKYSEIGVYLPRALREVADGGFWVPRALLSSFVDSTLETARRAHPVPIGTNLSRREKEVADLLLENLANKEIASRLNVSERTAKFHVSNLLAKYKVQRRADLILLFVQSQRG